jgi:hypothetical protein
VAKLCEINLSDVYASTVTDICRRPDVRKWRFTMRKPVVLGLLTIAVALALVTGTSQSQAYEGPWCAWWGGGQDYFERCSMRSFEMCLSEIRGTGGSTGCSPNPNYRPAFKPAPQVKRAQRQHY